MFKRLLRLLLGPISPGRQSLPEYAEGAAATYVDHNAAYSYNQLISNITSIERLAITDSDFSYAIENIVRLAATELKIQIPESSNISKERASALSDELNDECWLPYTRGFSPLINGLFYQIIVYGAISCDFVIANNLTGVDSVAFVNPKTIKFLYKDGQYLATQQVGGQYLELNTTTYRYYPYNKISEFPYGLPPFVAALGTKELETAAEAGVTAFIKKIGVLGFLEVAVNKLSRRPQESETSYYNRSLQKLKETSDVIQKGLNKGYVITHKDGTQMSMSNITANVSGAQQILDWLTQKKLAGLKQDPSMLGRNFSTSETFARVMLAKFSNQLVSFQNTVSRVLEDLIYIHTLLRGIPIDRPTISFTLPMVSDRIRHENARSAQWATDLAQYNQGLISQDTLAQLHNIAEPDLPAPRISDDFGGAPEAQAPEEDDPVASRGTDVDNSFGIPKVPF